MIRCLIVDDEPIAVRVLTSHLEQVADVAVRATCTNALEALRIVREGAIDLIFLDIEMPALTGVGFVEALERPPRFIFTTAHRDYAVRGFELDAVDYLLKPVGLPRLLRALERYRRLEGRSHGESDESGTEGALNVRVDRRTVRIDLQEIRYIESMSDYVVIHTDDQRYTTKLRLGDLEEQMSDRGFVRIHRSYLVSLDRVDSFTATEVQIGDASLPVSRTYRRGVVGRLRHDLS